MKEKQSKAMKETKGKKKQRKQKKIKEPEFLISDTNMETFNYRVYYMKPMEKVLYFLIAFLVGAVVAYIFYGGLAVDEFGNPTQTTYILNSIIMGSVGITAGIAFLPIRTKQIITKRTQDLKLQFRELLDSLATSLASGKNVTDSFQDAQNDLANLYEEGAYILRELQVMQAGLVNNIAIEKMLLDFGERSGIDDIKSFSCVFETCYRTGGNIKDVIKNTKQIISDKIEIETEIQTIVTGSKTEQNMMMAMPIALIALIKLMSPEFAENYRTATGIGATTVAVIIFVIAYYVGKKVLDIKI
jgi:tight adherence protein B